MRRFLAVRASVAVLSASLLLASCGLTSGSPMVDDVQPGSVGKGKPLEGVSLAVTSKQFSEQLVLGTIAGLALKAAGADVVDRTGVQGSIGAREAVKSGEAALMYEYTGTGWITYLGHDTPVKDPQQQWLKLRDEDKKNGITWLPQSSLNNTYALAVTQASAKKYGLKTLSDMAALANKQPATATFCLGAEFASRDDGFPGVEKAYGMKVPAGNLKKMDDGLTYTQVAKGGSCTYAAVFNTDGRIEALKLQVLEDDKRFFPTYNAAPMVNSEVLAEHPQIAEVLAPVTKALTTDAARKLNAEVDVKGRHPHDVAKEWLVEEGFIKEG
ncbi:glycine betaine ABC transporter substrate-binding protein [Streptomyces sp. A7024]|uniref:Glycine betaine ABC transporter substrate-binding protein n=1 Tax=Streptomyces coryli TaxID=1128680 RepID=A0A6G4U701_9ACTN|nr:glycine betaine ABC transporter substrate-binding protein [Streptomyces coryli]NGN67883.1 glycine betaine ABC transporter substrate-binding protein [Streptomyces coryli]